MSTNPISKFLPKYAEKAYTATASFDASESNMDPEDKSIANKGWRFTQPYQIPNGLNKLSGGACGGIINLLAKYNDDGTAPVTNWSCVG